MAEFAAFGEHPWSFEQSRMFGLYRAFGHEVVDGDTIDVIVDPGFRLRPQVRIRLAGVNTPEIYGVKKDSDEYLRGMEAKSAVVALVEGLPLLIKSGDDTGKYGRWVCDVGVKVSLDGYKDLGNLLVDAGFAVRSD